MRSIRLVTLLNQRRRRVRASRERFHSQTGKTGFGCGALLALLWVAFTLAVALVYAAVTAGLPVVENLPALFDPESGPLSQPTRVVDRSGEHLIYTLENPGVPRRWLPLESDQQETLSPTLAGVMVAARDPGFWRHAGFSWQGLSDPLPRTLAERLADRFLLEDEPVKLRRTLRMRLLAAQITARFGRPQVLEWYLNTAALGHLTFGADSAARLYLNRSAAQLDLAGSALIAAVDEAPALNPLDAPQAARERQRLVLDRLLLADAITETEYLSARAAALVFMPAMQAPPQTGRMFALAAVQDAEKSIGRDRLERGGLVLTTTLDYDLQTELECAARAQTRRVAGLTADEPVCATARLLPDLSSGAAASVEVLASAAVLDVTTAEVLAYVESIGTGGETEAPGGHAPGSLLTPFVAVTGFARGLGPASLVWDIPTGAAEPPNGATYRGPLRLRTALANDILAPFQMLLEQVGAANAGRTAETLGLRGMGGPDELTNALAGGGQVGLLEMAQAYSVFARLGMQVGQTSAPGGALEPILVNEVRTASGQMVLPRTGSESRPVLDAPLAYLLHHILADTAARQASLGYPDPLDIGRPSAAKVGLAENEHAVWTVGYTPQRLSVAWLGATSGAGGPLDVAAAAGLWHAVQRRAVADLPVVDWNQPDGITRLDVCDPSGLLPTPACPDVVTEIFVRGSEPAVPDNLYRGVQINRETGRLATVFTPPEMVEERTYLVPPPEAQAWALDAGLPQPPEAYDDIHTPLSAPSTRLIAPASFSVVRGQVVIRGTAAGEDFSAYRLHVGQGLNPLAWEQVGDAVESPVADGDLGVWDTRGLYGLYAVRLQVVRVGSRVDTAVIQVTVDNDPPQLEVVYPSGGEEVTRGANGFITLQARLSDNLQIARVEWLVDGLVVGEQTQPPFSYPWQVAIGAHRLVVRAVDLAGNETVSAAVDFRVRDGKSVQD